MKREKTVSYKCPVCLTKKQDSEIKRQADNLFFCQKCGSKISERHVNDKLAKLHDLRIANTYIEEKNIRLKSNFKPAIEGEDPPDAYSINNDGEELKMEITKYAPNFWSELLSKGTISGNVDPIQWLIEAIRVKAEKNYDENFRKDLVLLLEGNLIVDDYFEQNEVHFTSLTFNQTAFKKLGFREIWYVSLSRNKAFQIY